MTNPIQIKSMGYQCILLQWKNNQPDEIVNTAEFIRLNYQKEILDLVPTYREIALFLHRSSNQDQIIKTLEKQLPVNKSNEKTLPSPIYRIPVCYDAEKGFDLEALAEAKNLNTKEVIQLHTNETYLIHFLGFLPGFPYLSGLNKKLHHPRLPQARTNVPSGSVGIAANQTGVYPQDSPGGWNIIGRTPIKLFDIKHNPPALLHQAKHLQFYAVSDEEYKRIQNEVSQNNYEVEVSYD